MLVAQLVGKQLNIVAVTWTTPRLGPYQAPCTTPKLGPYQAPCTTPKLGPYQAPIIRRANLEDNES